MKKENGKKIRKNKWEGEKKRKVIIISGVIVFVQVMLSAIIGIIRGEPLGSNEIFSNEFLNVCHTLMGASMSVVFLGISMLNMLTDNSEKVYWMNDSERLMKSRPDFISWCRIGYVSLGLQLISYIAVIIYDSPAFYVAFSMFFIDGLISVIRLFHMSTEVFSNRDRVMKDLKDIYDQSSIEKQYEYYVRTIANFGDAIKNGDTERATDDLKFLIENTLKEDEKKDKRKKEFFKMLKNVNDSELLLFEPVLERVWVNKKDEFYKIIIEMIGSKERIWLGDKVADVLLDDIEQQLEECDKKYEEQEKELLSDNQNDYEENPWELDEDLNGIAESIYNNEKGKSGFYFTDYFFKLKDLLIRSHRIDYAEKLINILQKSKMPEFIYKNPEEENGKIYLDIRTYSKLTLCIHDEYGYYYDYSFLKENEKNDLFSLLFPILKKYWTELEKGKIPDYFKRFLQGKLREELNRYEGEIDYYEDFLQDDVGEDQDETNKRMENAEKRLEECKNTVKEDLNILFKCSEESDYKGIVDEYTYLIEVSDYMDTNGNLIKEMRSFRNTYEFSEITSESMSSKDNKKSQDFIIKEWLKNYCEEQKKYYLEQLKKKAESASN